MFCASKRTQKLPVSVKHRCEGFIHADVFMRTVTNIELPTLMEQIHLDIFGKTIQQVRQDKAHIWQDEMADYSLYESTPATRGK